MEQFVATIKSNVERNRYSECDETLYKQLYSDVLCKINKIILEESETSVDGKFHINLLELIKESKYYNKFVEKFSDQMDTQMFSINASLSSFYKSNTMDYDFETNYDLKEPLINIVYLRVVISV